MKKILSVAVVVIMIAALCVTAFAVEDYGLAIKDAWSNTVHVSRDEIRNGDDSGNYVCGTDPAKTYDVTFPTGQTGCIFWGWTSASADITGFGYSINNGGIVADPAFTVVAEQGVIDAGPGAYESRMKIAVPLTEGTQMVRCYVFYGEESEIIWQTKVVVGDSEGTAAKHGANVDAFKGIKGAEETSLSPTLTCSYEAGSYDSLKIDGWYGANISMDAVGYKVDDGEVVWGGSMDSVANDDPVRAAGNGGPKAMRIHITADVAGLTAGDHTVSYVAKLADASTIEMFKANVKVIAPIDPDCETADAEKSSFDSVYVNTDHFDGALTPSKDVVMDAGDKISLLGWVWPAEDVAVDHVYYTVDDGNYVLAEDAFRPRPDVDGAIGKTGSTGIGLDDNCLTLNGIENLTDGTYTVKLYAHGSDGIMYYMATLNLTVGEGETEPAAKVGSSVDFVKAYLAGADKGNFDSATPFEKGTYDAINIIGWFGANYAIDQFGYKLNDGEVVYGAWASDAEEPVLAAGGKYAKRLTIPADISSLEAGDFTITYVAKLSEGSVLEITKVSGKITAPADPAAKVGSAIDAVKAFLAGADKGAFDGATPFEKGTYDAINYIGWFGANYAIDQFGYKLNDGEVVYGNWSTDVPDGDPVRDPANGGDLAKRFTIPADISALEAGEFTVTYVAKLAEGSVLEIGKVEGEIKGVPAEEVGSYVDAIKSGAAGEDKGAFDPATPFELGTYDVINYIGWYGANYAVDQFGYKLNDGEPVFGNWSTDVDAGDPVRDPANGGDLAKRFTIPADISTLGAGNFAVTYVVKLSDGSVLEVGKVEGTIQPGAVTPPATGNVTAIIVTAAVLAIGVAVVIGKKRIAE